MSCFPDLDDWTERDLLCANPVSGCGEIYHAQVDPASAILEFEERPKCRPC